MLPDENPESLRQLVENAASVTGLLLTTEVVIAEAPKEEQYSHAGGGGMPGGLGGMGIQEARAS